MDDLELRAVLDKAIAKEEESISLYNGLHGMMKDEFVRDT